MTSRQILHEESFSVNASKLFDALLRPSAIQVWWQANRAMVLPEPGGLWAVAWGENEDDPDFITTATIREYEPGRRVVLSDYRYRAKSGPLPFQADFVTSFTVEPSASGSVLSVLQTGFPTGPEADEFHAGCLKGWKDTFANLRAYLEEQN